jgi:hypothetical protein
MLTCECDLPDFDDMLKGIKVRILECGNGLVLVKRFPLLLGGRSQTRRALLGKLKESMSLLVTQDFSKTDSK